MYGKLIDGELYGAPKKLNGDGVNIWNPPAEMYLAQGWKLVVFNDPPDNPPSGYYYEEVWEEQMDEIEQAWTLVPLPDDIDEVELVNILFGEGFEL